MQFLWKYVDDLIGKGLDIPHLLQLLFYASARFVPIAIPIAMLISSVMIFGKLGEQYELIALKSSGISIIQIFKPIFILVLSISLSSFLFSNYIMPVANLKNATMIYNIQKKKPAFNIKEGIFYQDIENFSIKVRKKESDNKTLHDIIIYEHTQGLGIQKVILAKTGIMELTKDEKQLELTLYDGHSYHELLDKKNKKKKIHRKMEFEKHLIRFNLANFAFKQSSRDLYKGHYAMMTNQQLNEAIDSLTYENINKNTKIENTIKESYLKKESSLKKSRSFTEEHQYKFAIRKINSLKSIVKNHALELEFRKTILAKHKIEWHRKIVLSLACLIFFFIGAPLGSIIQKGGFGIPVIISIAFFVFYHVLSMIGEKSAKELSLNVEIGMWMTNIIFLPIAIFLTYKASKDAIKFY